MIQTFKTHLTSKQKFTENIYLFTFQLDEPKTLEFIAGQYLILFVPLAGGLDARRLYSVASPPGKEGSFELLVHILPNGVGSEYLMKITEQDVVTFQGPAGRFTLSGQNKNQVFLATGTGYAPMRSMLYDTLKKGSDKTFSLLWGLPTFKDVYFTDELRQLAAAHPNFSYAIFVSREENLEFAPEGEKTHYVLGRITKDFVPDLTNTDYYICGNRDMVEEIKLTLSDKGVQPPQIIVEKF